MLFSSTIRNFKKNIPQFLIQRALLTFGDYFPENKSNFKLCLNEAGTLRTRNENWRLLFDDVEKNKHLLSLLKEIKTLKESEILKFLNERIKNFLKKENYTNWRYYFVKNPQIFVYCSEIKEKLSTEKFQPFKNLNYLDDKNTAGHPGFQLYTFKFKDELYKFEVRYKLNANDLYEIKFYEYSEIQKNLSTSLITVLNDFNFEEMTQEDKLYFCIEVSSKQLKQTLEEICSKLLKLESNATN